jgi:predicted aspartyl protease
MWLHRAPCLFDRLRILLLAGCLLPNSLTGQVEVPLRMEHGWFLVPVTVGGDLTLDFIVDTGAALSAVTGSTLRRMGVEASGSVQAQGASGAQELPTARIQSLELGTLRTWNAPVLVLDDEVLTPDVPGDPPPYDGVLGADVLGAHDVLLDPVAGVLKLFGEDPHPDALPPLADPLPLWRIAGPILGHDVTINGSVMPAILDTGARRVVVSPRGARNARATAVPGTRRTGTPGVGREDVAWEDVDLTRVQAGDTDLGALAAQVGSLPIFRSLGFGDRAVVLLGNPALRGCPVLISYRRDTIRYCRRPAS